MALKKVLLTGAYSFTNDKIKAVQDLGYYTHFVQDENSELNIDVSDFDAVVCNGLFLHNDIVKFKNLKLIQTTSKGLDRLPLDYAKENNIEVKNAKDVYSIPLAEWVIMRTLELYKNAGIIFENQKNRVWEKQRNLFEIAGKTVLIIGAGSVGKEVAKRFGAFSAYVIAVDKEKKSSEYFSEFVFINDVDAYIPKSDIIVLALPLTKDTRLIFNADRISKMKSEAVLINVSRGAVLDEEALTLALKRNKIKGAALDVFYKEPLSEKSELWDLENVYVSSHNAFVSNEANKRLYELILSNLKKFSEESNG